MKNIKFTFEEIFKNGGSRKHSMTIDLSIQKNWEAVCNYDQFSETKLGQRIDALLEINEIGIAEFEINRAQKISNESFKKIILGFAMNNDLSSMQIKTTKSLFGEFADLNLLYPSPKWLDDLNINGLDRNVVMGVVRQESQFSTFAKSGKSAYGLMQVLPSTARMARLKFLAGPSLAAHPRVLKSLVFSQCRTKCSNW